MGRKRKILKSEDTDNYPLLPPCKVCEGPAGGFHYGVNTCEACKGFFHRSSNGKEVLKCETGGECTVSFTIQKICKKCRYAKCLAVGMAKQAIKTGRYTVEKRTKDIMELKCLQDQRALLEECRNQLKRKAFDSESSTSHKLYTKRSQQDVALNELAYQSPNTNLHHPQEPTFQHQQPSTSTANWERNSYCDNFDDTITCTDCSFFAGHSGHDLSPSTRIDNSSSSGLAESSKSPSPLLAVPNPHLAGDWTNVSDASSCTQQDIDSNPIPTHKCSQYSSFQNIHELYSDSDKVVDILIQARNDHIKHLLPTWPWAQVERLASQHVETCKLQQEIYGGIARLQDHVYDSIYYKTGLDVDDRRHSNTHYLAENEKYVRAFAKFAKRVPGFSYLDIEDKITLIKYSRNEFLLFMGFNTTSQGVVFCADRFLRCPLCSNIAGNADITNMLNAYILLHEAVHEMELTLEERVVSTAIALMAPDRDNGVRSERAALIYELLNNTLINLFKRRFSKPLQAYAKLINIMVGFRTFSYEWIKFLMAVRFDKYSDVLDNPIFRELFGGVFFDDFESSETEVHKHQDSYTLKKL